MEGHLRSNWQNARAKFSRRPFFRLAVLKLLVLERPEKGQGITINLSRELVVANDP